MKWQVIVNPLAGAGKAGRHWDYASHVLSSRGVDFSASFTDSPATTRRLVTQFCSQGSEGIAVYGGDGTLSDTAAILSQMHSGPVLAVLPAGSGNDWARAIGFSHPDISAAVNSILKLRMKSLDTAVAEWENGRKHFLNSAGTGLDAIVLRRAIKSRRFIPFPKLSYILSLAFSAFAPPVMHGKFTSDDGEYYRGGYTTFTAGVGCYSGGGMRLSPAALPDDGKLDGLCLTPLNFFTVVLNLGRVFDGTLHKTPWARSARSSVLRLDALRHSPIILELDGEPVDVQGSSWLRLETIPESLKVIVPEQE